MLRKKRAAETELGEEDAKEMYTMLFGSEIKIRNKTYSYDPEKQPKVDENKA